MNRGVGVVTKEDIEAIKVERMFEHLKVRKAGEGVYRVIGYNYGKAEVKCTDDAEGVAKFLNGY